MMPKDVLGCSTILAASPAVAGRLSCFLFDTAGPDRAKLNVILSVEIDIAAFLGIDRCGVHVAAFGDQFVVSVKPDPGYSELVAYIFEFCTVRLDDPPTWMSTVECGTQLDQSVRRFRWILPEEMERDQRSALVDGDVIRGVHYFFSTTLPRVPASVPTGFLRPEP